MATSKAVKLPISRRIQQRLADTFTDKEFRIPEAENFPPTVDKRSNTQREAFVAKHRLVADFYVARVMHQWIKNKFDLCKDDMCKSLEISEVDLEAGEEHSQTFDNVVLNYKCTSAQMRLDPDKLRTALITEGKLSASLAERCIELARAEGKKPLHLRPSTTAI